MNFRSKTARHKKIVKVLLTGGGTGGSVAPLLAIAEGLTAPPPLSEGKFNPSCSHCQGTEFEFLWIGTKNGPEREMVEKAGIKFMAITGGKWRRYFSFKNFIDIFKIKIGFWQSLFILLKSRPDLVITAGSFVSVPAVWAAWFLGAKVLVHQQDVRLGLANKLMACLAKVVTVTFEDSLATYGKKAIWTGNPVRQSLTLATRNSQTLATRNSQTLATRNSQTLATRNSQLATQYGLKNNLPIVLILGGGTGAESINKLVAESLSELTKFCQIIHITGKNKSYGLRVTSYESYEFLDVKQMAEIYSLADVVVSRCGLGVLSELSYLGKPAILIPLPDSHQEDNAIIFAKAQAAVVLKQKELTFEKLTDEIEKLIKNQDLQKKLSQNIKLVMKQGANEAMVKIIRAMM
ncbi:UDP-N-acetylglucosamine--N-acetylmuramyl-(pentapeptide) pyrophosphoryl-undecaprenol N-acetylglucosamine transferase [Patescibacteria group bacterium]|nr:UDP-N-acetylglucosamine--N-acetylmuramyl-(pentapeptide) pyrophosphoryl-undecaprenol N-acetylglucosamine transferase [Patescibacteria group bacterium]MBU2233268.1 UDP-N-acetylglucosamine--N-acetylmuramyl-(pentapeptide) pyrophosphoryl-undecaprenol N-acetylglucosamine transferase [Patescibacteria group bacterium]MBU2264350.1 UDP-N-acetylglucosamine--N-acetylmuramyl-(pentapeptide) pyrophosphoryl-undecaprenol N-acetylglucosamine transferase [Patescibacteria group bacterium]